MYVCYICMQMGGGVTGSPDGGCGGGQPCARARTAELVTPDSQTHITATSHQYTISTTDPVKQVTATLSCLLLFILFLL